MDSKKRIPEILPVLESLKDFQRDTAEYIFKRFYLDGNNTKRFLLADEVGLGKTLVARGVIARTIEHLWEKTDRIDIVYICSNSDIARQNLKRLSINQANSFPLATRITLLAKHLEGLDNHKVNLVSLTPQTSFNLKSSSGRWEERVFLFILLNRIWGTQPKAIQLLAAGMSDDNFGYYVRANNIKISNTVYDNYSEKLKDVIDFDRNNDQEDIHSRYSRLCQRFGDGRIKRTFTDIVERNRLIFDLRRLLAKTCIGIIKPRLIILDEFQRFRDLMREDNDAGILAHELFRYADTHSEAKVLLLSATPYKMYTCNGEISGEDHYRDFLETIKFLQDDPSQTDYLKTLLDEYRYKLYGISSDNINDLESTQESMRSCLIKVMCRTERLAVTDDRSGMLEQRLPSNVVLESGDAIRYVSLEDLGKHIGERRINDYWESAPYLLNFMEAYKFKSEFLSAIQDPRKRGEIANTLKQTNGLLLPSNRFSLYKRIDPSNPKLRNLEADTIENGAWRLLWVPPSLPYYTPSGVYSKIELLNFTKRLVFSNWKVVPKAVATLLSYDVERRVMKIFDHKSINTPEARKAKRGLLRFALDGDRVNGMPVLSLIYPCVTLARQCDPLKLFAERAQGSLLPSMQSILQVFADRVEHIIKQLPVSYAVSASEDEAWYWAAPILMDIYNEDRNLLAWLDRSDLAYKWSGGGSISDDEDTPLAWIRHVNRAQELARGKITLGRPPKDLYKVLAQMAIGSPGIVSLRAVGRVTGGEKVLNQIQIRDAAGYLARSFLSLFNTPESMALLRGIDPTEPYWRRVIEYCIDGNLQSVMDEYIHILCESLGPKMSDSEGIPTNLVVDMASTLRLRASMVNTEDIVLDSDELTFKISRMRMRMRYATRFGDDDSEDEGNTNRKEALREAFNSPFWPFVLITTSIGQEGLDFHPYCHAVMHWNLPSNPVDLEQREGRVHRFKGHAIRKNLALDYMRVGDHKLVLKSADPWYELFEFGKSRRPTGSSDIIPFWVYQVEGGAKIERHVPALPLSKESAQLITLRETLALYRIVFGQSRQEDLLAFLSNHVEPGLIKQISKRLVINLAPPKWQDIKV